jgi:hypothetical protein
MELAQDRRHLMAEEPQHISTNRARAGSTPHMTRYILAWGLGLVIVAFIAVLLIWH